MKILKTILKSELFRKYTYLIRSMLYNRLITLYHNQPIKQQVLFNNFNGRGWGDSQCVIAEAIHKCAPDVELLWTVSGDAVVQSLPEYIRPVKFESIEYYKSMACSAAWVYNVLLPIGSIKRDEQLYIQTWHGDRAFKKILNDASRDAAKRAGHFKVREFCEVSMCDYIVTGSSFAEGMYRSALGFHGKFLAVGMPRNDRLIDIDEKARKEMRKKLNLPDDVKVMTYAPTYRDSSKDEGTVDSDINLVMLLTTLEARDDCEWRCLLRAHGGDKLTIRNGAENHRFIDVTQYPDMNDLLIATDLLVTDYSSCATDFVVSGRPVLLYQDDYEKYITSDRALYFDMKDFPMPVAHNMVEAIEIIRAMTPEKSELEDKAVLEFYGSYENGTATEKVKDIILQHIKKICG